VLVGCSDDDPHIPLDRVRESSRVLSALGGTVTERIYRGRDHMINDDEVMRMRRMLAEPVS
jgi:predicted esterase